MTEPIHQIDELLANVLADDVPGPVHQRLRSQLADFRTKLSDSQPRTRLRTFRSSRRIWLGATVTAAAIALVACVFALLLRPEASFAEVIAAVQRLPWIHVSITEPDGDKREVWYSAEDDISATRNKDWIEYYDHKLKVYHSYDVADKVLYRVPEYTPRRANKYALIAEALPRVLGRARPTDKRFDNLEFLGQEGSQMELLEQKSERIEDGGRQWLEYRLTVRHSQVPDPVLLLFRVDPATMLPDLCRMEGKWQGKPIATEQRLDYPARGPANIHDLGVPQTAKLIDRVPSDDIVRILETIRAGRQRMDDYRAIVVERMDDLDYPWWLNLQPLVLYRKGDKTRSDWLQNLPRIEEPADQSTFERWLRDRVKDSINRPVYISDGPMTHHIEIDAVVGDDGRNRLKVTEIKSWRTSAKPGDNFPPYWSRSPEFVCRPPLGIPSQEFEPVIDATPSDGPAGSILLRVRRTGRMPRAPDPDAHKFPPPPDVYRNWLEPARDFVAVRFDMLSAGETGKEEIVSSTVIEKLKQSPRGIWYATRFRVKAVPPVEHDQIFDIFIDFDVEMPDALFELPRVGQVLAEYEER